MSHSLQELQAPAQSEARELVAELGTQNTPCSLTTGDNRHVRTTRFCSIHEIKQEEPPLKIRQRGSVNSR